MDFSKLSSNEKLAVYGAVAAIVGSFLGFGGGGSFGLLTGVAMLVIVFLPQFSPSTKLPGTKGSLMVIVGGAAGLGALLSLLALFTYGFYANAFFIGLLLSAAGGVLMGWASWQIFQAEGGKFNMGMASGPSAPPPPPASTYTPPPPASTYTPPPPAPMAEPPQEPMGDSSSEDHPEG